MAAQQKKSYIDIARTWTLGLDGGIILAGNDLTKGSEDYFFKPVAHAHLDYCFRSDLALRVSVGGGETYSRKQEWKSRTAFFSAKVSGLMRFEVSKRAVPFFLVHLSGLYYRPHYQRVDRGEERITESTYAYGVGIGIEYYVTPRVCVALTAEGSLTWSDRLEGLYEGDFNDGFFSLTLGCNYFFAK